MTTPLVTRILFATDFSDDAGWAQEYARYLATMWNATLDVIHVIEGPHWSSAERSPSVPSTSAIPTTPLTASVMIAEETKKKPAR